MYILSIIQNAIRGAVCFQFTHFPCDAWDDIYTLSYYHQIGSMNYYPLFRVRSWNNGVRYICLYVFLLFTYVLAQLSSQLPLNLLIHIPWIRQLPWHRNFKVKWWMIYVFRMHGPICTTRSKVTSDSVIKIWYTLWEKLLTCTVSGWKIYQRVINP